MRGLAWPRTGIMSGPTCGFLINARIGLKAPPWTRSSAIYLLVRRISMRSTTSPASLGPFQTVSANWSARDKEQGPAQRRRQRPGNNSTLWSPLLAARRPVGPRAAANPNATSPSLMSLPTANATAPGCGAPSHQGLVGLYCCDGVAIRRGARTRLQCRTMEGRNSILRSKGIG